MQNKLKMPPIFSKPMDKKRKRLLEKEMDEKQAKKNKMHLSKEPKLSDAPLFKAPTFTSASTEEAMEYFYENGYVIISNVMNVEHRVEFIIEYVKKVLEKQPWSDKCPWEVIDPETGRKLDIDKDTYLYIKTLLRANVDPKTRNAWKEAFPFHRGFAAPCDPAVFHLHSVWKLRENPILYDIVSKILGIEELWVDINRCIFKLPGEGDDEFLHWDNPFLKKTWRPLNAISGKAMVTDGLFYCVPRTHTEEAHALISAAYSEYYPHASPKDAKFKLDHTKPNPLNLPEQCEAIVVPSGSVILWSSDLLHGVAKSSLDSPCQLGIYLGFMEAIDRPEYAEKAGISELADRVQSYKEGRAPKLWPSKDPIHYYPFRFQSNHNCLLAYAEKTNKNWPWLTTRTTKEGKKVPHFLPPIQENQEDPYPLSNLGKRLLGLEPYHP